MSNYDTRITRQVVIDMFLENTGKSLCDSGMVYGYHYEKDIGRDFDSEPEVTVDFSNGDIIASKSTYHHMIRHLKFQPELNELFDKFWDWYNEDVEPSSHGYLVSREFLDQDVMSRFFETYEYTNGLLELDDVAHSKSLEDFEMSENQSNFVCNIISGCLSGGVYGDGGEPEYENTYNYDNPLDKVLQYMPFVVDGDGYYVFVQAHTGCDVRGGYSAPVLFSCDPDDGFYLENDMEIRPVELDTTHNESQLELFDIGEEGEVYWRTDDGYHWYREGACGYGAGTELQNYDIIECPRDDDGEVDPTQFEKGILYYDDETGDGYCPITQRKLEVY